MYRRIYISLITLLLAFVIIWNPAATAQEEMSRLDKALEAAGENRPQLEKVLENYSGGDLQQKYAAAVFLIENMEGHSYVTYVFHDTTGQEASLDILAYPNFDSLLSALRVIEQERGELDYRRDSVIYDLATITAEYLIQQTDCAFKAWHERPWAKHLTFDQFCQYVLPYRGSNEPLENWRQYFFDKYHDLASGMNDSTDAMEAAVLINNDITAWFKFDPRFYLHPTDQGFTQMLTHKMGRCEDMTNLTIYAMRANGLAVTSDYTPFWANSGNNHAWNAILTKEGRVIPFMGAEANPGEYRLANKLAKVYRKTYASQPDNLIFQTRKQEKVPGWLAGKTYSDVTADYTSVSDVAVRFEQIIPDSVDIAYLCVFNSGKWQAIDWGRISEDVAIFTDIGIGIAYLPAIYLNEEVIPYAPPFILTDESEVKILVPNESETIRLELSSTTARKQEVSTDGVIRSSLTPGQSYELFWWNDGWESFGKAVAGEGPLAFENVPSGTIYWLVADESDKEERIFTFENGSQVWW